MHSRTLLAAVILLPGLLSCSADPRGVSAEIRFAAAQTVEFRRLQFYVYDMALLDEHDVARPFRLDGPVALVDLAGDPALPRHATLRGTLDGPAASNYRGIRFTVGVPFELNHANPLTAAAPLNRGDLFWTWQSGYKFLRADYVVEGREHSFHLGSTGCSSASALRPPQAPCARPNRVHVELRGDPLEGTIRFSGTALGSSACTGDYAVDPACATGYAATGLQPDTGQCADARCSAQKLWSLD